MSELKRIAVGPRMSQAAVYNGVVYLAGIVPKDATQDIAGQTQQVLDAVENQLVEYGTDKSRILSCQIYLANISDISKMNEVWDAWVVAGNTPPRATVQALLARPELLIQIVVTAAL